MNNGFSMKMEYKLLGRHLSIAFVLYFFLNLLQLLIDSNANIGGIINNGKYFNLGLYNQTERIFPIVFAMLIIFVFSNDFRFKNFEFLFSLPVSRFKLIIYRFLRILILYLLYFLIYITFSLKGTNEFLVRGGVQPIGLWETFLKTFPVSVYLGSLALLVLVIGKKEVYSLATIFGYWSFEYFSNGIFTKWFNIFICYSGEYGYKILIANRILLIFISIICLTICVVITQRKIYY